MRCVTVVGAWGACGACERCLGLQCRRMRRNTSSCTSREIEALLDQLIATCTPHLQRTAGMKPPLCRTGSHILPLYVTQVPIFCLYFVLSLTLRATRAPYRARAGPPSNRGVTVSADFSHDEYERHRACLSVKTSNDQPPHVALHAPTLRGAALSN